MLFFSWVMILSRTRSAIGWLAKGLTSCMNCNSSGVQLGDIDLRTFIKPEIEKLLNELKDSVFFRTRLHDEQDRLMGIMELDSVDKTFTIQLRIREGRLLPLIAGTGERHKNGFSFSVPGCKPFYIAYDIHLNKRFIAAFYQDYRRMKAIRGCQ